MTSLRGRRPRQSTSYFIIVYHQSLENKITLSGDFVHRMLAIYTSILSKGSDDGTSEFSGAETCRSRRAPSGSYIFKLTLALFLAPTMRRSVRSALAV